MNGSGPTSFFTVMELSEYTKTVDFCVWFLNPAALSDSHVNCNSLVVTSFGSPIQRITSSVNSDSLTSSIPISILLISF